MVRTLLKYIIPLVLRTKQGERLAKRFVAGETIEECKVVVADLRKCGFKTTIAYLGGEHLLDRGDILRSFIVNEKILKVFNDSDIAVKLSQFGLFYLRTQKLFDLRIKNLPKANNFFRRAFCDGVFVWIDAEELACRAATLGFVCSLPPDIKNNIGLCVQAYARDFSAYLSDVIRSSFSVRICKGAYKESKKKIVSDYNSLYSNFTLGFVDLLQSTRWQRKIKIQIATQDTNITDVAEDIIEISAADKQELKKGVEFGVLLGRHTDKYVSKLTDKGYVINIYTPFGPKWREFIARRIMEKPSYLLMPFK